MLWEAAVIEPVKAIIKKRKRCHSIYLLLIILILPVISSGCKGSEDEWSNRNLQQEIDDFMVRFAALYPSESEMTIEKTSSNTASSEGGEIVKYEDSQGGIMRYRLTAYGETGQKERNYYFLEDYIYYTGLEARYSCPITYTKQETDILYRIWEEGIISDGSFYGYDKTENKVTKSERLEYGNIAVEVLNDLLSGGEE